MIGQKIAAMRKQAHMTQLELARKLGVSKTTVVNWEAEDGLPRVDSIGKMAELFDKSADYFISDSIPVYDD